MELLLFQKISKGYGGHVVVQLFQNLEGERVAAVLRKLGNQHWIGMDVAQAKTGPGPVFGSAQVHRGIHPHATGRLTADREDSTGSLLFFVGPDGRFSRIHDLILAPMG
jgi:hypothetical protein